MLVEIELGAHNEAGGFCELPRKFHGNADKVLMEVKGQKILWP